MRRASVVPVSVAVTSMMLFVVLVFLLSRPIDAQAADPLAGKSASIAGDASGNVTSIGPIAVTDCAVAPDASVVVEDEDGTKATLIDGINVTITASATEITIEGTAAEGVIVGEDVTGGDPVTFDVGRGTIVSSTGITCGNEPPADDDTGQGNNGGADGDQYNNDDREQTIIIETIPDKPLPKTGGVPLLLGAGALLTAATLISVRLLRP